MIVLVAYATDHGSTRGVADRIAGRLQMRGVDAEARAVADIQDISRYEAVVLGSAIHGGKWLPEARQFADRNAAPLRERPVWLFSVSTLGDQESMFPPRVANRLRALRKETPEVAAMRRLLHPRAHRNFAGAIARSQWPATGRAFFRASGGRYGDHRNWPAIEAWADLIAAQLHVKSSVLVRWRDDMARIGGEIVIDRPVDVVFDYVADQSNEPQYNPQMVRAQKITTGPVGAGTKFRSAVASRGRTVEMLIEITGYNRPHRLTSATTMQQADIRYTLTFEPAGSGTRMRWSGQVRPKGAFKLLGPLIAWMGRHQERRIWISLKQHLEAAPATTAS